MTSNLSDDSTSTRHRSAAHRRELTTTIRHAGRRTTVELSGDFDPRHRDVVARALTAVLRSGAQTELDLSGIDDFGSAAVSAIVEARRDAEGADLVIVDPAPLAARVLELCQLGIPIETRTQPESAATSSSNGPRSYQQLVAASVSSGREAVCITTDDLDRPGPRIVYVNPAFCELSGFRPDEIIGDTPRRLQGPLTDRLMLDRLRRQLSDDQTFHGESVNYRRDGTPFFMNWKISPVHADDGRYFVAHQADSTSAVRLTRNDTATSLVRNAVDREVSDRNQRLAYALVAGHQVLLAAGAVSCEIVADETVRAGDELDRGDDTFERARRTGSLVSETVTDGYELALVADSDDVTVRVRITGLTRDHLALTDLDHHVELVELARSLARPEHR